MKWYLRLRFTKRLSEAEQKALAKGILELLRDLDLDLGGMMRFYEEA